MLLAAAIYSQDSLQSGPRIYGSLLGIGGTVAEIDAWPQRIAAVTPIDVIASLANAGTLCAFVAVALCVLVRRRREPDARRPFRTPVAWIVRSLMNRKPAP